MWGARKGSHQRSRWTRTGRSTEAARSSGIGGRRRNRRRRGSHTAISVKTNGFSLPPVSALVSRSTRTRPPRTSRTIQLPAGEGRKERAKSAASATALATGAEGWGGSAGWKPLWSRKPTKGGAWRERKRRRKERSVVTRRRKETHAAEARTRSSGVGRRRKISAMRSLVSAATGGDGEAISSPAIG
ncbi:Os07g0554150, partial [Oryza sativa Japonica Group]